jgi:hypothetical protein
MTSRPAQMPKAKPAQPAEHGARLRLTEAERILAKLHERRRAGVELPPAMIDQARERVTSAREAVEALRGKT